ncbi:ECF transporter S component [Candidatus Bathyarchaeota archaeon]|nr:ECF transporter S component [Candidatus Bathyarchaeota archaeon]
MFTKTINRKNILIIALVSCLLELIGAFIQVNEMLRSVGISSVFSALSLVSTDKVNFALYLTFAGTSLFIILWAGGTIQRGRQRLGGLITGLGAISSLVVVILPFVLGYPSSTVGLVALVFATALMCTVAYMGYRAPSAEVMERALLTPREIAVVAVFSALTAVLTGTTGFVLPSPTGGYTHIGDTIIYVAALLFGCKIGGFVGIIGPVVADLFVGYPRWFVTVLAHGSQGFIAGVGQKRNTVLQVLILTFSGLVMATTYFFVNIFIKGYPIAVISLIRDIFGQTLVSIILGLALTKASEKAFPELHTGVRRET